MRVFAGGLFWAGFFAAFATAFPRPARASVSPVLIESANICRAAVLPLDALNISARAKNSLEKHGIKTVLQLIQMPPASLLDIPGFGQDSFASAAAALWEEGLYLGVRFSREQIGQLEAMQPKEPPPEKKLYYLQRPADSLELGVRAASRLEREGILQVQDLAQMTEEELLLIEGLGGSSVKEIKRALSQRGLSLGMSGEELASLASLQKEGAPSALETNSLSLKREAYLQKPADSLELGVRAASRLKREGILQVWELAQMTEEELLLIEGLGGRSVKKIRQALSQRGLQLGMKLDASRFQARGDGQKNREASAPKPLETAPAEEPPPAETPAPASMPLDSVYEGNKASFPGFSSEQIKFFSLRASSLDLDRAAWKTLALERIQYVWEIAALDPGFLIRLSGFNRRNVGRLRKAFSEHGWELGRAFSDEQLEEIWSGPPAPEGLNGSELDLPAADISRNTAAEARSGESGRGLLNAPPALKLEEARPPN